jgi:transposase
MAGQRLSMHRTREILRQKWQQGRSHREVASTVGVSVGMVSATLGRAERAGLASWEAVESLTETEFERRLYDPGRTSTRPRPDPVWIHTERQRKGVTLELLHLEYLEQHPDGYRYTQFCEYYRRWCKQKRLSMRQVHRAGEKLFVDYAGYKPHLVDPTTGEVREVELFVAVLGASSYTYAVEFFGGVSELTVPDQLKSGVSRACRYEPVVQRSYHEWSQHYDTTILPARPRKPRDKAKVEVGVQVAERWILARLRNETFFSIRELNERIAELLADLNARPMRTYGQSRRERFELLDQPALRPLPASGYELAEWKHAKVNLDYHVELERHFYSVPHALVHERVELRFTAKSVEVLHKGQRVAVHRRDPMPGAYSTVPAHMPKAHQKHLTWTPTRLIAWGRSVGPETEVLVAAILADRPHPEQGYRSCLGILRLAKQYGDERLEAACTRAVAVRARSYRHVQSILKNGLDRYALEADDGDAVERELPLHENVRGRDYYND